MSLPDPGAGSAGFAGNKGGTQGDLSSGSNPGNTGNNAENGDVGETIVNPESGNQVFFVGITSLGFSPKTLEINQEDTVTWTNNAEASSWPASAVHPTHTIYPGFDANKELEMGETYSFTFDKIGTWNYHDHLSPSRTGTIIVK